MIEILFIIASSVPDELVVKSTTKKSDEGYKFYKE